MTESVKGKHVQLDLIGLGLCLMMGFGARSCEFSYKLHIYVISVFVYPEY